MFRRLGAVAAIAAVAALVAGCGTAPPKSRIDYDRKVDFSVYRTYGFPKETGTDRGGYSTLVTSYFKSAVSTAMEARGYKYTEDHPDLLVNFFMNTHERTETQQSGTTAGAAAMGYGYYGYRNGMYSPWPMYDDNRTITYKVGTINVDVVDAAKKQLIWEGVSEGRMSDQAMANPRVTVNGVVTELMRQYPGKPQM